MTDFEHELRHALHDRAERITTDTLRDLGTAPSRPRPSRPRPSRPHRSMPHRSATRTRWTLAAPLVAAACVALIAIVITFTTASRTNRGNPPGGPATSLASLAGSSWALTSVREGSGTTINIPQDLSASITFEAGAVFSAQDGADAYRATYQPLTARAMLIAAPTAQTEGGSVVGHNRAAMAAVNGIHALLYSADGQPTPHSVAVWASRDQLKLTANGYTLTFTGQVLVATSSAPAPSPDD